MALDKTKVVYQIYPKSYKDTTGNGIGDFRGIIEKIEIGNQGEGGKESTERDACPLGALCHCGCRFLHRACCCGWNHLGGAVQQTFGLRGADHCRPAGANGITGWQ